MLAVGPDFPKAQQPEPQFLVVDDTVSSHSLPAGKGLAVALSMVLAIALSVMGWLSLATGLMFLLLIMLGLGLLSAADLRRRFPFEIWLIVASALAVSQAVDSGLMANTMDFLSPLLISLPPVVMLILVYLLTLFLTEVMTNNAAAALMFPVGYTVALTAGVEPMAFVMAVALGGSASFLTPFGYTTNLMVQNLGGYSRGDYVRFGWSVSLAYSTVVLVLLPRFFRSDGRAARGSAGVFDVLPISLLILASREP